MSSANFNNGTPVPLAIIADDLKLQCEKALVDFDKKIALLEKNPDDVEAAHIRKMQEEGYFELTITIATSKEGLEKLHKKSHRSN